MYKKLSFSLFWIQKRFTAKTPKKQFNFYPKKEKKEGKERE